MFYFNKQANIDSSDFIKPEYLLTVKVAEQLALSKKGYVIKLEEDTSTFAKSCVKSWNNGLVNDDSHNSKRNGKIDNEGIEDIISTYGRLGAGNGVDCLNLDLRTIFSKNVSFSFPIINFLNESDLSKISEY